ncbi:MAG TPA: NADH-quinone oxidoreductase subunit N [Acidobacteriota bacterium]|nr:NADH-quinone oxidoreductase subunit N [Acidobacteriota bacterium]
MLTSFGLVAAFLLSIPLFDSTSGTMFYGMIALDQMAVFFKGFLILTSFLVLLAAPGSREFSKSHLGEFYALLLGVTLAMMLLASAVDMLMLFLSLEMVSVTSYIMVGYLRNDRQSNEASLKYILFGAVSTGSMLYGITLLYGITGTTKMAAIREALAKGASAGDNSLTLLVSTALILAGFGFKTAAVPFHFWCPDVYTGAPTPVTAFLSVAPKAAGFATLVRFFFTGLSDSSGGIASWVTFRTLNWTLLVLIISVITMMLGNIAALRQDNMKRMLAYSSIAHAGYVFMGAVVLTSQGIQSILIYLITYLFMNLGAFLIVIEVYNKTGSFDLQDYRGMWQRSPFLTISMTIFMLSLMGIPPFAGFFGKLYVFAAAVNNNMAWYAVIGALNSVIAVYYYARVIKAMIIEPGEDATAISLPWTSHVMVWIMLLPTAGLMIFWNRIQELTSASMKLFLGS